MSDSEVSLDGVPPEIAEIADAALTEILPEKSRKIYENTYAAYIQWKKSKKVAETSQQVLLAYFKHLSEHYKPPTLWSHFSMLRAMINLKEKINIAKYVETQAFLKQKTRGYTSKKSKLFSANEIQTFLNDAPDLHDLDKKVIALFAIFGALRGDEVVRVTTKDVERQGSLYLIKVPVTKNLKPRSFVIPEQFSSYLEEYLNLRPKNITTDRFFINYQSGKCTVQVIGKNKIAKVPQKIAQFLKLSSPKKYTGHSFRRTAATMLVDAGANMTTLKRLGGWKSDAVAEGYIEESMSNKTEISNLFSKMINGPSSSKQTPIDVSSPKHPKIDHGSSDGSNEPSEFLSKDASFREKNFKFENCNITINFK